MATAKKATTTRTAVYRCTTTFSAQPKGEIWTMVQGDLVRGNHPAVKLYPEFFELVDDFDKPVEQATAAPGEKRSS